MVDWGRIARLSHRELMRRAAGKGVYKETVYVKGFPLELVHTPKGIFLGYRGRGIRVDESIMDMLDRRDSRILNILREEARPYQGHWYVDLSTPLPEAVESLMSKRREEGKIGVESLLSATRSMGEVERWRFLVSIVGSDEDKKKADELYSKLQKALDFFKKLREEGKSLKYALGLAERMKQSYPEPVKIILKYLLMEMWGKGKYDFYRGEWTLKIDGIRLYSKGDRIVRITAGDREVTLLPVEGSLVVEGRRAVELDFDPRTVSWFLYRYPGAAEELLRALEEEGKIPEYAKVLSPWVEEEERKRILEKLIRGGNFMRVFYAVTGPEDVDELLRLGGDMLGEREKRRLQMLRKLLEEVREKVKPYKSRGEAITPSFVVRLLKESSGDLPDDVERMLRAAVRNLVYSRGWGRAEEEGEGWWDEELDLNKVDKEMMKKLVKSEEDRKFLRDKFGMEL